MSYTSFSRIKCASIPRYSHKNKLEFIMRIVLVYLSIFYLGGTKFQCTEVRGGQNFSTQKSGGTQFQYTVILKKHQPPPPINNDRP